MIHALALLLFALPPLFAQNGIAEQYNAIYSDDAEQATFNHAPNAFLVEFAKTLKPGRALDVGMGQGRNAIYLAQQGWQVTGFDLSKPGGIVLVENFHRDTAKVRLLYGGFGDNELLQAFHGFRILHYEDVLTQQDWCVQLVDANRIVRLAAQRPKPAAPVRNVLTTAYCEIQSVQDIGIWIGAIS